MLQIDYDYVSKNISDYIIRYKVDYNDDQYLQSTIIYDANEDAMNDAEIEDPKIRKSKKEKQLSRHIREFSIWTTKCISIDIPFRKSQKVLTAAVEFKPEIFNNGIRPSSIFSGMMHLSLSHTIRNRL